jgi:hypothetical protein
VSCSSLGWVGVYFTATVLLCCLQAFLLLPPPANFPKRNIINYFKKNTKPPPCTAGVFDGEITNNNNTTTTTKGLLGEAAAAVTLPLLEGLELALRAQLCDLLLVLFEAQSQIRQFCMGGGGARPLSWRGE